jgi:hypothetical protein
VYAKDLRVVWKDAASPEERRGTIAAQRVRRLFDERGNAAFWEARPRVFKALSSLEEPLDSSLDELLGLRPALELPASVQVKLTQSRVLAIALRISATPQLFINGKRLSGDHPLSSLRRIVDEELAKVAKGDVKPGADMYERLVATGKRPDLQRAESLLARLQRSKREREEERERRGSSEERDADREQQQEPIPFTPEQIKQITDRGYTVDAFAELSRAKQRTESEQARIRALRAQQGVTALKPTPRPSPSSRP